MRFIKSPYSLRRIVAAFAIRLKQSGGPLTELWTRREARAFPESAGDRVLSRSFRRTARYPLEPQGGHGLLGQE